MTDINTFTLKTLHETNDKIFSIENDMIELMTEIHNKEQKKNEMEKQLNLLVEEEKDIIWSNSSFKNNDQRNAALNIRLVEIEEYNNLSSNISNIENEIKMIKLDIEKHKAEKNFHKRSYDINMNYSKSLQLAKA